MCTFHAMVRMQVLLDGSVAVSPRTTLCRLARLAEWRIPDLSAPFWRCYAVVAGRAELRFAGRTHALGRGRAFLIAPGTAASTAHEREFLKAYCHCAWRPTGRAPLPGIWECAVPGPIRDCLAAAAASPQAPGIAERFASAMTALVHLGFVTLPDQAWTAARQPGETVVAALALLAADPAHPPDNTTLGRRLGIHPHSLVRLFVRETGLPPQRYAKNLRLEEACRWLEESDQGIDAIAVACGFCDRSHFSRVFARHWRCPPAEYRRRNRSG